MARVEEETCNFRSADRKTKSSARTSSFLCLLSTCHQHLLDRLPLPCFAATQHGFSSSSSPNHPASQQVLDLQKDVQRMSHLLEQLSGRSSSPAGSRSGSPSRGSGTFVSSNSFVKPAGGGTSQPSSPVRNKRPRESRHPQSKSPRPRINQQSSQRTHTGYSAQHEVYESDWQYDSAHGPYLAAGDGSVWWGGPNSKGDGSDC